MIAGRRRTALNPNVRYPLTTSSLGLQTSRRKTDSDVRHARRGVQTGVRYRPGADHRCWITRRIADIRRGREGDLLDSRGTMVEESCFRGVWSVAGPLAAHVGRRRCNGAAVGIQLQLAAGPLHSQRSPAAGGRCGPAGRHPRQGAARRPASRVGGRACAGDEDSGDRARGLRYAARVAEVENPNCHIAWTTLAGIGQVESHHGTYHHATLFPNGDVRPAIRGVVLDGTNGTMRIIDSDPGAMGSPSDTVRAMGPMQFIPETWREYGVDANNDGTVNVDNIDDAALSAAGYLCWRGKDLATPRGWITALWAYNDSDEYARAVRDWATAYAAGHPL